MAKKAETPKENRVPVVLPKDGVSRFNQIKPFVGCSDETWRKLVNAKKAPQPIKIGSRWTVYQNAEVHRWLANPANYQPQPQE